MSDTPYTLFRVQRSAQSYVGQWQPLYFCPDPASPQEFVVGLACSSDGHLDSWRLLADFSKFECVYSKRLPSAALRPYFARVSEFLADAAQREADVPAIDELSEQLRWGEPLYTSGESAQAAAEDLFQTVVALLPESAVQQRRAFKSRSTESVRSKVNERLKVLLQLRFEQVVNERGYEEIRDGDVRHRLDINLRSGRKVGSVVSAWFGSVDSVAAQILKAEADLTTAQRHFGAKEAGLFVVRPFEPEGIHPSVLDQIDAFIEESRWRCATRRNLFEVDESEDRLADVIAEFM